MRAAALPAALALIFSLGQAAWGEAPGYHHPELGVVDDTHPAFQAAFRACDAQVYGPGVNIYGGVYHTKAEVYAVIRSIVKQPIKTPIDYWIIAHWAGTLQMNFIHCLEDAGFRYVKE